MPFLISSRWHPGLPSKAPAVARTGQWIPSARTLVTLTAIAVLALPAVLAPVLAPFNPLEQNLGEAFAGPSGTHWFGTDEFGRDILSRSMYGARTSLGTAGATVVLACLLGVPIGLGAAYLRGSMGVALMRVTDLLLAMPAIVLALTIVAVIGRGAAATIVAVTLISVPSFARVTQGRALTVLAQEYVSASRVAGSKPVRILFRTVLPNCLSAITVQAVVTASFAVLLEAALSYLGLGVIPPAPSWGNMLRTGQGFLHEAPHYAILPGVLLTLTVLTLDALGHGRNDKAGLRT